MREIVALLLFIPVATLGEPVSAVGEGFISPAPKVMDNVGADDLRKYFFRYWDAEAAPANWSPVLPKICHSGYSGLSDNSASQFKTGRGVGGYIDGRYRLDVRYDINGAFGS